MECCWVRKNRTAAEPEGSTNFPHAALTSLHAAGSVDHRPHSGSFYFYSAALLTAASHAPSRCNSHTHPRPPLPLPLPPPSMKRKAQGPSQRAAFAGAGSLVFSSSSSLSPWGWVTREPTVPGLFKDQEFLPSAPKVLPQKVPNFP